MYHLQKPLIGEYAMPRAKSRKRPCRVCRRWFLPDVRHKNRQKTCGPDCRTERHRRQCAQWNRRNKASVKANYLQNKLQGIEQRSCASPNEKIRSDNARGRIDLDLPRDLIQEQMQLKLLVIIEYIIEQVIQHTHRDNRLRPFGGKSGRAPDSGETDRCFQDT